MSDKKKESRFDGIKERATEMVHRFGYQSEEDLEAARAIASAALEIYGDFDEHQMKQFRENGIWNDHAAVQAALAAIRMFRQDISPARSGRI